MWKEKRLKIIDNQPFAFVIPKRFERLTHALEGRCSIQLSYGTILYCLIALQRYGFFWNLQTFPRFF